MAICDKIDSCSAKRNFNFEFRKDYCNNNPEQCPFYDLTLEGEDENMFNHKEYKNDLNDDLLCGGL